MDFYIFNQTLGVLRHDGTYSPNIVKGTSSFCAMNFGNARIATMMIQESNRKHIDVVITSEMLETMMNKNAIDSAKKPS